MSAVNVIGRTDLARRTRQGFDRVRRGQTVIVESYGQEEAAIVSIRDYRLLRAVSAYRNLPAHSSPMNDSSLAPRGLAEAQVAEALGRDAHTIGIWLDDFRQMGPAAMAFEQSGGSPPPSTRRNKPS